MISKSIRLFGGIQDISSGNLTLVPGSKLELKRAGLGADGHHLRHRRCARDQRLRSSSLISSRKVITGLRGGRVSLMSAGGVIQPWRTASTSHSDTVDQSPCLRLTSLRGPRVIRGFLCPAS